MKSEKPAVVTLSPDAEMDERQLASVAEQLALEINNNGELLLIFYEGCWRLKGNFQGAPGDISVDFNNKKFQFRKMHPGSGKLPLISAIGLKKSHRPVVLDATAGLGKDAYLMASLGAQVFLTERNPIVSFLLLDGLKRAQQNVQTAELFNANMHFLGSDLSHIPQSEIPCIDVIYLDPMYPLQQHQKKAQVKKEMQLMRKLVGADDDTQTWLKAARKIAQRVVVKRPQWATALAEDIHSSIRSKNHRFDIYTHLE